MLTPGAYLKHRRQAALLSVAEVAAEIGTIPRCPEHIRVEWLTLIEADAAPASFSTIAALRSVYEFDIEVLLRLERIRQGINLPAPRLCRICACSQDDACVQLTLDGSIVAPCHWIEPDLCSAHLETPRLVA